MWILRRLWIEKQETKEFQTTAIRFIGAYLQGQTQVMELGQSEFSSTVFEKALNRIGFIYRAVMCLRLRLMNVTTALLYNTLEGLFKSFLCWLALNPEALRRHYAGRSDLFEKLPTAPDMSMETFMKKMRAAAPHWRTKERAYILRAIQTKGGSYKGSYLKRLMDIVGVDKFKCIAFGKEKFCSNCGRSSYVGQERLWCCKRCVVDGVKPKGRYCNVKCQKAHWLKHKAEVHSGQ